MQFLHTCSAADFAAHSGKTLRDFTLFPVRSFSSKSFREAENELERWIFEGSRPCEAITDVVYFQDKSEYHIRGIGLISRPD